MNYPYQKPNEYFFSSTEPYIQDLKKGLLDGTFEALIIITPCSVFWPFFQLKNDQGVIALVDSDNKLLKTVIKLNPVSKLLNYEEGIVDVWKNSRESEQEANERHLCANLEGSYAIDKTNFAKNSLYKAYNVLIHDKTYIFKIITKLQNQ